MAPAIVAALLVILAAGAFWWWLARVPKAGWKEFAIVGLLLVGVALAAASATTGWGP